ncbi:MAG: hypothetical protein AB8F65_12265, partial [Woeseiaceae bacterium]
SALDHYDSIALMNAVTDVYQESLANEVAELSSSIDTPLKSAGPQTNKALSAFFDAHEVAPDTTKQGVLGVSADDESNAVEKLREFMSFVEASNRNERPLRSTSASSEFHTTIGNLSSHPVLMRALGLVVDIEFDAALLPANDGGLTLEVGLSADGVMTSSHESLQSAFVHASTAASNYRIFSMREESGTGANGFYPLPSRTTAMTQLRVETAVMNLMQATQSSDDSIALPTPPEAGMRLLDATLPDQVGTAMAAQAELAETPPTVLYAEQVTRGYRVDVRNAASGQWHSLCARRNRYLGPDGVWQWPAQDQWAADEGTLEPTVFSDQHSETTLRLRATMDLFEWTGFSLSVARPGDTLPNDGAEAPVSITTEVQPGSLLPQRFGQQYQFRARSVDIAGNSLSLSDADAISQQTAADIVTAPESCLRSGAVQPPVWYRGEPRGPGEAGDVIVLRDAEERRHANDRFRVHVLPAEVSLDIVEKHGIFDALTDDAAWAMIEAHRGKLGCDAEGELLEFLPWEDLYAPYFPDPLVKAAVLILPDGQPVALPRFDRMAIRRDRLARACGLEFRQGKNEFKVTRRDRTVIIDVPKGRSHTLKLAAALGPRELALLSLAQDFDLDDSKFLDGARHGRLPTLAPAAELTVIHATQRPLIDPVWVEPSVQPRLPTATTATLIDPALIFDQPSTGRLDVYANWQEPIDDPTNGSWEMVTQAMHAGEVVINETTEVPFAAPATAERRHALSHDFSDTRHRKVNYVTVATSRFTDFYPRELNDDPANMTRRSSPTTLHIKSTAPPAPAQVSFIVPTIERDTTAGGQTLRGHGVRIYLERGWFSSGADEQLAMLLPSDDQLTPTAEVSRWGQNPIHDSAPLDHLLGAADILSGAQTDHRGPAGQRLVLHDVRFSEAHGLPYVDIEFASQTTFLPLVQLALARFQPYSIDGCHVSPASLCQFVPLTPDRWLTVKALSSNQWSLQLTGAGVRPRDDDPGTIVEVQIEAQSTNHMTNDVAWRPAAEPVVLIMAELADWQFRWQGDVALTDDSYFGRAWRRRIVIREYEPFANAPSLAGSLPDHSRLISAYTVDI